MTTSRFRVLLAADRRVRDQYLPPEQIERLERYADWEWFECTGGGIYDANPDPLVADKLRDRLPGFNGLIVCHGAPLIDGALMDAAPDLQIIGELEGDRFASRMDLEAAWERNIRTVDTTNASSYPVAEWALGLVLVSLRNAGAHFRRITRGETKVDRQMLQASGGLLTGKRVGLIGGGHMGRRLIKLLRPFDPEIWVYDPYLPQELAEALDFVLTSLDNLLANCQVIVCLAPLTPRHTRHVGRSASWR